MILMRMGNKRKIALKIISYFPKHTTYIEPFFGAGGLFFCKPKAKYNIVNDIDADVYNLFKVLLNHKKELETIFKMMPTHQDLFNYWQKNEETEPVKKALRFLFLSNYSLFGYSNIMRFPSKNTSKILYKNIDKTHKLLFEVDFMNCDFQDMFKKINFRKERDKEDFFIYCDPPYISTKNNYSNSFTKEHSILLFDTLEDIGIKWAMSEFNNPFIIEQATQRNLYVNIIGERRTISSRNIEILITNYQPSQLSLQL